MMAQMALQPRRSTTQINFPCDPLFTATHDRCLLMHARPAQPSATPRTIGERSPHAGDRTARLVCIPSTYQQAPDHQLGNTTFCALHLELCALYSSTCLATFVRRRCMPIQLDLCHHSSACSTFKCAGQLSRPSADQPLLSFRHSVLLTFRHSVSLNAERLHGQPCNCIASCLVWQRASLLLVRSLHTQITGLQ